MPFGDRSMTQRPGTTIILAPHNRSPRPQQSTHIDAYACDRSGLKGAATPEWGQRDRPAGRVGRFGLLAGPVSLPRPNSSQPPGTSRSGRPMLVTTTGAAVDGGFVTSVGLVVFGAPVAVGPGGSWW